ncbi:MAG TPA: hypothetical protein VNY05_04950 [Candidatus Acidoferrales bacterium]|nr:hypothetical protein [Candidatus Acidoferrales bacterium]
MAGTYRYWLICLPSVDPNDLLLFTENDHDGGMIRSYSVPGIVRELRRVMLDDVPEVVRAATKQFPVKPHRYTDHVHWRNEIQNIQNRIASARQPPPAPTIGRSLSSSPGSKSSKHQNPGREDENSARTRVTPVFTWLRDNAGRDWGMEFLRLADGIAVVADVGAVTSVEVEEERAVEPSPTRLAWMIRNAHRLAPQDGRQWREYASRVIQNPARDRALALLDSGTSRGIPSKLILEGSTHADCLIECEMALLWIEGKRNDWLTPCTTWDVTRDQLARNPEAAWILATAARKDFWFVICYEHELKHHEAALVEGYRDGTWKAGWPHLPEEVRQLFRQKIGTATWASVFRRWPAIPPPL